MCKMWYEIFCLQATRRYGAYTSASWLWNWLIVNASDFKMVWLIRIIQIQFTFIIALPVVNKTLFSFHSFFFFPLLYFYLICMSFLFLAILFLLYYNIITCFLCVRQYFFSRFFFLTTTAYILDKTDLKAL